MAQVKTGWYACLTSHWSRRPIASTPTSLRKHHGAIHQDDEYRELLAKLLIEEHKKP